MPYIKLLNELFAGRNFVLIEETSEQITFEMWDKTTWEKIIKGINKDFLISNLTSIVLLLGGSFILFLFIPKPWGTICLLAGISTTILFIGYRVLTYRKNKLISHPIVTFNRKTGLTTGIDLDLSTFEQKPWQISLNEIRSLVIKWDDPRFDMAMLEVLDSNESLLYTFFGRSASLRQSAVKLNTWLQVNLNDEAEEFNLQMT